ncbi:MAG: Ig-like domain-containing protein, partial [Prevotellaceae bacterium]|nr:Ig-like domain-containing protein [Prevotellaceae bacterium]
MKKHLLLFKTLIIACLAMVAGGGISVASEAATLPVSFNGKKGNLPTGFTQSGLDSDYKSAPHLKFNDAGDYLILQIDSDPGKFSCLLKQNGNATSFQFDIQYSTDGTNYTTFKTITYIGDAKSETISYDFSSLSGVRYIKWIYTTKGSSTNIALGTISVAKKTTTDPSSNIKFSQNTGEILIGKTLDISKFVSTANGYTGTVTYSLKSGEGIASVSNQGIITGIKKGTAVITATAPGIDGSFAQSEADFTVTVVDNRTPTTTRFGADVDGRTFKVLVGQESSFTAPTATVSPEKGTGTLKYLSDNTNAIDVNSETGELTFKAIGKATITATFSGDEKHSASSASYTISYTDGSIVFDSNNNAFYDVKTDGYNSNNDNPGPTLVDQNGDKYTFTFYNSYRNNGGIQMKASSGKVTSPKLDMPYGYTVKVTTKTNNVNIKIGTQTATGSNNTVELSTTEANQSFTIYTGSSYAVVTKIEIIPTNIVYLFSEND